MKTLQIAAFWCAWVLWVDNTPIAGHASMDTCHTALNAMQARMVNAGGTAEGLTVTLTNGARVLLRCLPDTVDPRARE